MTSFSLFKPGDWLVLLLGLCGVLWLFAVMWQGGGGNRIIIRSGGTVVAEASLLQDQDFAVRGPLGITKITIQQRRVRVASDPSPRQYCVKQGWLAHPGDAAICLPNQVSVEIAAARKLYDTLNY